MGLENEGYNYDELLQEDDDDEEKVDRALSDILSDYSNLFFEDYVKPLTINDPGRCSAQACVKHHVYDWDFRFPIPNETVKEMDARFRDIGFALAGGPLTFIDLETFFPKWRNIALLFY